MNDAQLVQVLNRIYQLPQYTPSFPLIQSLTTHNMFEELTTLGVLHYEVDLHLRLDNLMFMMDKHSFTSNS